MDVPGSLPEPDPAAYPSSDAPYPPLGGLPPTDWTPLKNNRIELAVIEVKLDTPRSSLSIADALRIRDLAKDPELDLPTVEPAERRDLSVSLSREGHSTEESFLRGWRLASIDQSLTAIVMPQSLVVQTTSYLQFKPSLRAPFEKLLRAVNEVVGPQATSRIGLRYVNRLAGSTGVEPTGWIGKLNQHILGPISDPLLGSKITSTQQLLHIDLGAPAGAQVRTGVFQDPGANNRFDFLIDIDVFDAHTSLFAIDSILECVRYLNSTALSLFQHIALPEFRMTMDPQSSIESGGSLV